MYAEVANEQFAGMAAMTATDRPLADVVADFAKDGLDDPDQARLFLRENMAESAGSETGTAPEREFLRSQLDYMRVRQADGDFPADVDPRALLLMLIAAASAPVAFRRVGSVLTGQDPASAEFVDYYAEQLSRLVRHLKG